MIVGTEWLIEAAGCEPDALRDEQLLRQLFDRIMHDLGLQSVGAVWHKFDGEGGVTGLVALTESHLACHTYPEHGTATFNLYCCRTRPEWDWDHHLKQELGASTVTIQTINRGDQFGHGNPKSAIRNPQSNTAGGDVRRRLLDNVHPVPARSSSRQVRRWSLSAPTVARPSLEPIVVSKISEKSPRSWIQNRLSRSV
jgi:S-adenosylmethionine decarboxylase